MTGPWSHPGFVQPPVDPDTGPFPKRPFLETWWRHFAEGRLIAAEGPDGYAVLWLGNDGVLRFAGHADLTDYHSPLGAGGAEAVAATVAAQERGLRFQLDSLPAAGCELLESALARAGVVARKQIHETAHHLLLPAGYEEYLAHLTKRERHEVRRKTRRLVEAMGPLAMTGGGAVDFDDFVRLHRRSPGEKGSFMDDSHAGFFGDLLEAGGRVDVLRSEAGEALAAAFGFVDGPGYYLYNSAYDASRPSLAPGIVLIGRLIAAFIGAGFRLFDFLKGDEPYKLRLGAQPRPLFELTGEIS